MVRKKFDRFMVDVHIGTNRKLRRLTAAERWCHIAGVLAVAAQAPVRGRLLVGNDNATFTDYAELSGSSIAVARSTLEKLRRMGVVVPDEEHGCERVHDWEDYNPEPARDETAAERARRYRERRKDRNGVVTDRDAVTVTDRNGVTVTPGREVKGRRGANAPLERVANAPLSSSGAYGADPKATEEDRRLCRLLAEQLLERKPKAKIKSPSRWLTDMRLLRERDGIDAPKIEEAIRWVFRDQFWGGTIESPGGLREHFAQIWDRMHPPARTVADVEDSASYLARKGDG